MIITLHQRWTDRLGPGQLLGRWVVEALVFELDDEIWVLRSLFYDPQQGETVEAPFHRWDRGSYQALPNVGPQVIHILSTWGAESLDYSSYVNYIYQLVGTLKEQLRCIASPSRA